LEYTELKPLDWTDAEISKFSQMETTMRTTDRIVQETSDLRNDLESYIYDMRDKITMDSSLGAYATQAEKDTFLKKNEDTENWLYEDGFDATKDVYAGKLAELKALGGPVEKRASEATARPIATASLQKNIEKYKKWLADAQANDNFSHITEEEFSTCHKKCDEVQNWLYEMLDKQGSLGQNVDPAFTAAEVNDKNKGMSNVCSPIVHKPKPKPKVEPKKEEPKKAEEPAADAAKEPVPMETEEAGDKKEDKMEVDEA
jgi:heat shock protein 4